MVLTRLGAAGYAAEARPEDPIPPDDATDDPDAREAAIDALHPTRRRALAALALLVALSAPALAASDLTGEWAVEIGGEDTGLRAVLMHRCDEVIGFLHTDDDVLPFETIRVCDDGVLAVYVVPKEGRVYLDLDRVSDDLLSGDAVSTEKDEVSRVSGFVLRRVE